MIIVGRNKAQSGNMSNISSYPNQQTLLRISSQSTQADEEESGIGEGWRGVVGEVSWQRRVERINRNRRGCAVIWEPSLVRKGGGS